MYVICFINVWLLHYRITKLGYLQGSLSVKWICKINLHHPISMGLDHAYVVVLWNLFSSRVTKAEIERGYINNPSARRAVFLFLPEDRYTLPPICEGAIHIISLVFRPLPLVWRTWGTIRVYVFSMVHETNGDGEGLETRPLYIVCVYDINCYRCRILTEPLGPSAVNWFQQQMNSHMMISIYLCTI